MKIKKDKYSHFESFYRKFQKDVYKQLEANPVSITNILVYLLIFVSIIITFLGLIPFFRHGIAKEVLFYMNLLVGSIFLVEYFLRLWVCKLSPKFKKQGRFKYIFSPMPLIDFFASVPVIFLWGDIFGLINASNFGFSRILRLARFLRAAKFGRLKKIQKQLLEHPIVIGLITSLIFIFYSSVEVYYADQAATHGASAGFWNFCRNLFIVFTGEYAFDAQSFSGKLYTLLVYITGLVFGGIVLGRLVSFFANIEKYEKVPDGLSGHIVILNWTSVTDAIIRKLHDKVIAGKREIVVISEDNNINKEVLYLNAEYDFVYFLNASPLSSSALEKANIAEAHSLVLLCDEKQAKPLDFNVRILLTIQSIISKENSEYKTESMGLNTDDLNRNAINQSPHIICEIIDKVKNSSLQTFNKMHLKKAGAHEIISRNDMNNLLAQSALNPNIPDVFKEFLKVSDATNEIYLKNLPVNHSLSLKFKRFDSLFVGQTDEIAFSFQDDFGESFIPIGIIPDKTQLCSYKSDKSGLNPSPSTPISKNSKLIMISYEDPVFAPDIQLRFKKALLSSFFAFVNIIKDFFKFFGFLKNLDVNTSTYSFPINKENTDISNYIVLASKPNIDCLTKSPSDRKLNCVKCKHKTICEVIAQLSNGISSKKENIYFFSNETYELLLESNSIKNVTPLEKNYNYYHVEKAGRDNFKFQENNSDYSHIVDILQKSCVVLLINDLIDDPDTKNAFVAMDLKRIFNVPRITVEMKNPENASTLRTAGADTTICSTDYTNGIIALCAMEGGLFDIFNSLLTISDDTNEFYIYPIQCFKKINGKDFRKIQSEIYAASIKIQEPVILIGYISKGENGKIVINPRHKYNECLLSEEKVDSLILLAYNSPKNFLDKDFFNTP
jgi:voltage-gated potassium channel Kch